MLSASYILWQTQCNLQNNWITLKVRYVMEYPKNKKKLQVHQKKKKKRAQKEDRQIRCERQATNKSLQTMHISNAHAPRTSLILLCSHDFQKGYFWHLCHAFLPQVHTKVQIFLSRSFHMDEIVWFYSFNLLGFHPVNSWWVVYLLNLNSNSFQTGIRHSFVTLLFWYLLIFDSFPPKFY